MQNYYQAVDEMITILWMNSAVYLNTSINSGRIKQWVISDDIEVMLVKQINHFWIKNNKYLL